MIRVGSVGAAAGIATMHTFHSPLLAMVASALFGGGWLVILLLAQDIRATQRYKRQTRAPR